jgi:hypothetical protein
MRPSAEVVKNEDITWRLFTKGIDREQARSQVELFGDASLASKALDAVAIIA